MQNLNYMISSYLNIVGLCFDITGVIMLFKYGLPVDVDKGGYQYMVAEKQDEDEQKKWIKYEFRSKVGLTMLILGFAFQLGGSVLNIMLMPK